MARTHVKVGWVYCKLVTFYGTKTRWMDGPVASSCASVVVWHAWRRLFGVTRCLSFAALGWQNRYRGPSRKFCAPIPRKSGVAPGLMLSISSPVQVASWKFISVSSSTLFASLSFRHDLFCFLHFCILPAPDLIGKVSESFSRFLIYLRRIPASDSSRGRKHIPGESNAESIASHVY